MAVASLLPLVAMARGRSGGRDRARGAARVVTLMRSCPLVTAVLAAWIGVAPRAVAQQHPVTFVARITEAETTAHPGGTFRVAIDAVIPIGWHLYSVTQPPGGPITTTFAIGPEAVFHQSGPIISPAPRLAPDPNFGIVSEWYEDSAHFALPVAVSPGVRAGRWEVQVRVRYQTCTDRFCLPPREDTLHVRIRVAGAPMRTTTANHAVPPSARTAPPGPVVSTPRQAPHEAESFMLFLWLAATMGALSLLTPCVFPMVPITVSYFSRRHEDSRARAAGHALLYGAGIVGAFSGLGLGATLLFGVAGLNRFAADPWLNLAIGVLFVGFALSLFEVLHVALPSRLVNWLDRASRGTRMGGIGATLLMGVTFAVTTFTCTAPFVGTLLVSAAEGDWRWPAAGLLVFSLVLALPLVVLALVPGALARLPRSGEWMQTVKGALGFIELGAATKFLSNADLVMGWGVFTHQVVVATWVALGVLLALYLLGVRPGRKPTWRRPRSPARPIAAAVAVATTLWLARGLAGHRLGEFEAFLPPAGARGDGVAGAGELPWMLNDLDGALRRARGEHRLVLIDFTGYTCTNCRWMEANMFTRPSVRDALTPFVRVRLFTDGEGDLYRRQQALEEERFHTVALPFYAVVDSLGAPQGTFLGMTRNAGEFVRFLSGARGAQR